MGFSEVSAPLTAEAQAFCQREKLFCFVSHSTRTSHIIRPSVAIAMAAMSGGGGADCFARCLKCIPKPEPAPSVAMRGGMLGSRRESKPLPLRLDRVKSTVEPDRGPDAPVLDSPTREHHQEIIDHATGKTRSSGPKPGLLKAIVFLSRLKEGPNLHLSQYMSDPKVRQKLWRDLEKSTTQKKLTRRGGFLGLGVGYEQVREVRLHTENLSYRHVVKPGEDEKEKFINFDDIRWVGACKGSSKRWKIKMKNEPEYEFICDTHDHRNVRLSQAD